MKIVLFLVSLLLLSLPALADEGATAHFGVGVGKPYGGAGISYEVDLGDEASFFFGGGHTLVAQGGYAVGLRASAADRGASFRPRLSYLYGTSYLIETRYSGWISEAAHNVGLGGKWRFGEKGRHGLDLDLWYAFSPSPSDVEKDWPGSSGVSGAVTGSIGYRYHF